MTREEAISVLKETIDPNVDKSLKEWKEWDKEKHLPAVNMAIEALQREEHLVELEAKAVAIIKSERHGEWKCSQNKEYCIRADFKALVCNICGCNIPKIAQFPKNYCPNCGAKMKGQEE